MFDFLDKRTLVDIILSAEVIFCAVLTLSLFIAVHAMLGFLRQSGGLYTRLAEIDAELNVLQASIPGKLERIRALREDLAPLQDRFKRIQGYYSRLQYLDRKWQQEQLDREREEEEEKNKQIQRQRMGLDRYL